MSKHIPDNKDSTIAVTVNHDLSNMCSSFTNIPFDLDLAFITLGTTSGVANVVGIRKNREVCRKLRLSVSKRPVGGRFQSVPRKLFANL